MLLIAGGFVLGETVVLLSLTIGLVIPALLAVGLSIVCRNGFRHGRRSKGAVWLSVFLLFVLIGMARAGYVKQRLEARERLCREMTGSFVELEGRLKAVEVSDGNVQLTLEDNEVRPVGKTWGWPGKDGAESGEEGAAGADNDKNGGAGAERGEEGGERNSRYPGGHSRIPCVLVSWKPEEGTGAAPAVQALKIGMTLGVRGELEPFGTARNPGEFDFRSYYRAQGLDCRMFGETVETVDDQFSPLPEFLREIRETAKRNIKRSAASGDAGIFTAAVLGDKKELDSSIKDLYQKNGIAHLLAISGLHLSIIGMGGYRLLRKAGLGFGPAGLAGAVFIVCYGVMTGGSPSVVRAVVMMSTGFFASYLGRTYDLISAASLALFLLVWESPELLTQGGVQLSFGAVFAVGAVLPVIQGFLGKERKFVGALSVSAAIQLVTLPIILWNFFQFPVYGIFLNLLVIPLMGGVICSGIGAALLGGFSGQAGVIAAGCGHYILQFYEWLCQRTALLPFHTLVMGRPGAAAIILYYAVLTAVLAVMKNSAEKTLAVRNSAVRNSTGKNTTGKNTTGKNTTGKSPTGKNTAGRSPAAKLMAVCLRPAVFFGLCVLMPCLLAPHPIDGMEVLFMDVGQGDGILLRSGDSAILIDGGSTSEKNLGQYRLEPCLKSCGVSVIEFAFVSHGDQDHISGVRYLLESSDEIVIRNLLLPCQGREDEALLRLADLAEGRGTRVTYIDAGDYFEAEKLRVTCLYPGREDIPADKNEESEVLKVDYGDCHILFTGDMSGDGEMRLLSHLSGSPEALSEIQILKAAHHGSRFSSRPEFLDALAMRWSVISYAEGNSYGHPHKEVMDRLNERSVKIYETAKGGAVTMKTDGKKIKWKTFLK